MGNCCGLCNKKSENAQLITSRKASKPQLLSNKTQRKANWTATGVIAMRDAGLKEIPSVAQEVGDAARTLDATNNRIVELPAFITQLTNLQKLILENNRIAKLPQDLSLLVNLKVLVVDHNSLTELPSCIGDLAKLEKLTVCSNILTSLPTSIGCLSNLKDLGLKGNKLKELPESLGEATNLETIDASDNYIQVIPRTFGGLHHLKILQLDSNRVAAVPSEVLLQCVALHTLSLHSNPITIEDLEGTEGFKEFDERRKAKYDKMIAGGVAIGPKGLDEGVDRKIK